MINVRIVCEYISEGLIHVFKEQCACILCICMLSTSSHSRVISLSKLPLPFLLINIPSPHSLTCFFSSTNLLLPFLCVSTSFSLRFLFPPPTLKTPALQLIVSLTKNHPCSFLPPLFLFILPHSSSFSTAVPSLSCLLSTLLSHFPRHVSCATDMEFTKVNLMKVWKCKTFSSWL